jgi:hypothetical protein
MTIWFFVYVCVMLGGFLAVLTLVLAAALALFSMVKAWREVLKNVG